MSVVGSFIDENNASRTLAPAAVSSQVLLMILISLGTIIAFNILRPRNKIVYEPKVKYHVGNKRPPRISDGLLGWFPPLVHTKEPELLDRVGLDAVAFLRFLRMLRWMFTAIAVFACAVLIPINISYNLKHVNKEARDMLSMLTLRDVAGSWLFVHVAATYIFTFLVVGFVWLNWRKMLELRATWLRSSEYADAFYARTLMIRHVPRKYQSDEGIRSILETLQVPYPATSVHIARRVGRLPELIEFQKNAVRELEMALVRHLKNGKIGKKRPAIKKGGLLGMGSKTYDAIDFYTNKVKRCEAAIEAYRNEIDLRRAENYGFASMAAVPYAHIVAHILHNKNPRGTTVTLAPNPKDIIWENVTKSETALAGRKLLGWVYLCIFCFFNTLPLLIVSFLANLASLTSYVGFLESWSKSSHITFSIMSGVLPPAVSALFGWILPNAMRWLSKYQGAITRSRLDRAVVARYFAFLIISQLVIFTLIGVIINSVQQIVQQIGKNSFSEIVANLNKLPRVINTTYIDQANYWLTFFPLRGFLALFDLAQVLHLFIIWFKTRLFGRTPRDIREWTQPPDFEYAIYYSNLLFMSAVALVFSPIAPLVPVAAAVVFWISSFVYKYQLMFVFVTKVESGGRLWNVVINRLLWTVMFMQALMALTIGLQEGWRTFQWISTLPPVFIVLAFKVYINRTFLPQFRWHRPGEQELRNARIHSERADVKGGRLEKRFGHPALYTDLFTPLLHAKMMHLLPQVYQGRIGGTTQVRGDGGKKLEAEMLTDGIKIAAIQQSDLEYDPILYQRDRGELDWDARSMSSANVLNDGASLHYAKSHFYAGSVSSTFEGHHKAGSTGGMGAVARYDTYLSNGPMATSMAVPPMPPVAASEIELARLDSRRASGVDQLPLLSYSSGTGVADPRRMMSPSPVDQYRQAYPSHDYANRSQSPLPPPPPPAGSSTSLPSYNNAAGYGNAGTGIPPQYAQQQQHPSYGRPGGSRPSSMQQYYQRDY